MTWRIWIRSMSILCTVLAVVSFVYGGSQGSFGFLLGFAASAIGVASLIGFTQLLTGQEIELRKAITVTLTLVIMKVPIYGTCFFYATKLNGEGLVTFFGTIGLVYLTTVGCLKALTN